MKKHGKLAALALAAVMGVAALTGCGGGTSSAAEGADGEPITITIWHTRPESDEPTSDHQRMLAWAENYNATNTDNIHVEIVGSKKDDAILTAIAAGTTPDIFMGCLLYTSFRTALRQCRSPAPLSSRSPCRNRECPALSPAPRRFRGRRCRTAGR